MEEFGEVFWTKFLSLRDDCDDYDLIPTTETKYPLNGGKGTTDSPFEFLIERNGDILRGFRIEGANVKKFWVGFGGQPVFTSANVAVLLSIYVPLFRLGLPRLYVVADSLPTVYGQIMLLPCITRKAAYSNITAAVGTIGHKSFEIPMRVPTLNVEDFGEVFWTKFLSLPDDCDDYDLIPTAETKYSLHGGKGTTESPFEFIIERFGDILTGIRIEGADVKEFSIGIGGQSVFTSANVGVLSSIHVPLLRLGYSMLRFYVVAGSLPTVYGQIMLLPPITRTAAYKNVTATVGHKSFDVSNGYFRWP